MIYFPIPATEEHVALARAFLLEKWLERHDERYPNLPQLRPTDLSGSCIFSSMFSSRVFGGTLRGSKQHVYTRLDGIDFDLNADAKDVKGMPNPYRHRARELNTVDFSEALKSCQPRVESWVAEFRARLAPQLDKAA